MKEWLDALYEAWGVDHPTISLLGIAALGALLFGGAWLVIGRAHQKKHQIVAPVAPSVPPTPIVDNSVHSSASGPGSFAAAIGANSPGARIDVSRPEPETGKVLVKLVPRYQKDPPLPVKNPEKATCTSDRGIFLVGQEFVLPVGKHPITCRLDGYLDETIHVEVAKDKTTPTPVEMEETTGSVWAEVFADSGTLGGDCLLTANGKPFSSFWLRIQQFEARKPVRITFDGGTFGGKTYTAGDPKVVTIKGGVETKVRIDVKEVLAAP